MPELPPIERFTTNHGASVYRLPCEAFPGFVVYAHLVLGLGSPVLIDAGSGYGPCTAQLLAALAAVRDEFGEKFAPADLGTVLITHGHIDHFGGLHGLLEQIGSLGRLPHAAREGYGGLHGMLEHVGPQAAKVEVAIHQLDRGVLTAYQERMTVAANGLRFFLRQAGVAPDLLQELLALHGFSKGHVRNVPVTTTLTDGQTLRDGALRCIHTPGHCPGQVCVEAGDVLLSADHILERTSPHQSPESIMPYTGLGHYLESLEKIAARAEATAYTVDLGGHEGPIRDVHGRIAQIVAGHERKLDRLLTILGETGPATIQTICRRMYPAVVGFHVLLALEEVGAHVEYLYRRDRLTVANLDEVDRDDNPPLRYAAR